MSYAGIPFSLSAPTRPILNSVFLETLFSPLDSRTRCWVTSFKGDPADAKSAYWRGQSLPIDHPDPSFFKDIDQAGREGWNTFFSISAFFGEDDGLGGMQWRGRRESLFALCPVIVFDDFGNGAGGKVPWDRWPRNLVPTWVLETSPGNFQVGVKLDKPCTDPAIVASLLAKLVTAGLRLTDDPGMKSVTRYMRLPQGGNWKETYTRYRPAGTSYVPHALIHWAPSVTTGLRELAEVFGVSWEDLRLSAEVKRRGATRQVASDVTIQDDPWWGLLQAAAEVKGAPIDKGPEGIWISIRCPWTNHHTGGEDTGAAYLVGGGFNCFHGHCQNRNFVDVRNWLCGRDTRGEAETQPDENTRRLALDLERTERIARKQEQGRYVDPDDAFVQPPPDAQINDIETAPVARAKSSAQRAMEKARRRLDSAKARIPEVIRERMEQIAAQGGAADWDRSIKEDLIQAVLDGGGKKVQKGDLDAWRKTLVTARKNFDVAARRVAEEERLSEKDEKERKRERVPGAHDRVKSLKSDLDLHEETGAVLLKRDNLLKILEDGAGILYPEFRYNDLTSMSEIRKPGRDDYEELRDEHYTEITTDIHHDYQAVFSRNWVIDAVSLLESRNGYNPVINRLRSLKWDGVERLASWLPLATGCPRDVYHQEVGKLFLLGAVSRVFNPGSKFDHVITLTGEERIGKSRFCEILALEAIWYADVPLNPGYLERTLEAMHGAWIVEIGELQGLGKAEDAEIKRYITCRVDRFRRPYARKPTSERRKFIMIGTTNESEFLKSVTGNRRFLPVACSELDLDWLKGHVEQLYAEAVLLYDRGVLPVLPEKAYQQALQVQEDHRVKDEWEDIIAGYLSPFEEDQIQVVPANTVWEWVGVPLERRSALTWRMRRTMTALGYQRSNAGIRSFSPEWAGQQFAPVSGERPRAWIKK